MEKLTNILEKLELVWGDITLLVACYRNCLKLAAQKGIRTIAFPTISCGAYRFPAGKACPIALATICECLAENRTIEKVFLVVYSTEQYRIYSEHMQLTG